MTEATRTHSQGETELCWLYALTTSIHKTLQIKLGTGCPVLLKACLTPTGHLLDKVAKYSMFYMG